MVFKRTSKELGRPVEAQVSVQRRTLSPQQESRTFRARIENPIEIDGSGRITDVRFMIRWPGRGRIYLDCDMPDSFVSGLNSHIQSLPVDQRAAFLRRWVSLMHARIFAHYAAQGLQARYSITPISVAMISTPTPTTRAAAPPPSSVVPVLTPAPSPVVRPPSAPATPRFESHEVTNAQVRGYVGGSAESERAQLARWDTESLRNLRQARVRRLRELRARLPPNHQLSLDAALSSYGADPPGDRETLLLQLQRMAGRVTRYQRSISSGDFAALRSLPVNHIEFNDQYFTVLAGASDSVFRSTRINLLGLTGARRGELEQAAAAWVRARGHSFTGTPGLSRLLTLVRTPVPTARPAAPPSPPATARPPPVTPPVEEVAPAPAPTLVTGTIPAQLRPTSTAGAGLDDDPYVVRIPVPATGAQVGQTLHSIDVPTIRVRRGRELGGTADFRFEFVGVAAPAGTRIRHTRLAQVIAGLMDGRYEGITVPSTSRTILAPLRAAMSASAPIRQYIQGDLGDVVLVEMPQGIQGGNGTREAPFNVDLGTRGDEPVIQLPQTFTQLSAIGDVRFVFDIPQRLMRGNRTQLITRMLAISRAGIEHAARQRGISLTRPDVRGWIDDTLRDARRLIEQRLASQ